MMINPSCDFYCARILSGQLAVKVYLENERLFAFALEYYFPIVALT